MRGRQIVSRVLAVLGGICVVVALIAGYARVAVFDSDQFADRAVAALDDPAVREVIARKLTDEVVLRVDQNLIAVRPLVQTAASAIVGSPPFQSLFRAAARDLHRTVFTRSRSTATATIADVGVLLASALRHLDPAIAARVPPDLAARISAGEEAVEALDAARRVDDVRWLALASAIAAVVLLAGAIAIAPRRRPAFVQAGIAVAIAGAVVAILYELLRGIALAGVELPDDRAAVAAVWSAFLGDLRMWALVTLAIGTVIAAAAASLLRPADVTGPMRRAWQIATTVPPTPGWRVARALTLVAAGVVIVVERRWLLDAALVLLGVYVLYQGVSELLRMIVVPSGANDAKPAADARRRRFAPWIAGGFAAVVVVVLIGGLIGTGATQPARAKADPRACNGHVDSCDRTIDEIAFAGSHNAMSGATYPNWLFAQHEKGISGQLEDGVRALLIDAYFGQRVGDRVLTELPGKLAEQATQELGEQGTEAALRVRDSLIAGDAERGPRTTWLCHGFCEVGSISLVDGLREIAEFLAANPNEVVLIIVQDEGPGPRDIAKAVDESGLRPFIYTGPMGPPWPTLRELIDSGQRAIMMFEHGPADPAVPWYHDAYAWTQETPYHFTEPSEFSCAPNRGPSDAPLFLLNHWIDTSPAPRPSNAAIVNDYDFLLDRARECERERGQLPNIVAVDFYRTGDLIRVVDTLNGVGDAAGG